MKRFSRYSTRAAGRAPYPYRKSYYRRPRPQDRRLAPAAQRGPAKELKSFDYYDATDRSLVTVANVVGATSMTTGMGVVNIPATGNGFYEVIGNKCQGKSLAIEAEFAQPQTDVSSSTIRLMVVLDRQVNGAFPAIGDILYDNNTGTTFNSAINIANRDRFQVFRDMQFTLDPAQGLTRHYEAYIRLPDLEFVYKAAASRGAIASINSGALYLIAFYVQHAGTTAPSIGNVHCRTRYYDS